MIKKEVHHGRFHENPPISEISLQKQLASETNFFWLQGQHETKPRKDNEAHLKCKTTGDGSGRYIITAH